MIALKLTAIEWLKARKRFAFWTGLIFFAAVLMLGFGIDYYQHVQNPNQRTGRAMWRAAVDAGSSMGFLVVISLVVLLSASEKTWRTERQNVIDGLSRTQYFGAKLLLVFMIVSVLWLIAGLYGGVFTVLERGLVDTPAGEFMSSLDRRQLGGLFLLLMFVGCLGLFFGTLASSSGAALALAFLFLMVQPVLMSTMADNAGTWMEATAYMPMQVMSSLTSPTAHDAARLQVQLDRLREMGAPLMLSAGRAAIVATVYAALFSMGAWLSIRTRDL